MAKKSYGKKAPQRKRKSVTTKPKKPKRRGSTVKSKIKKACQTIDDVIPPTVQDSTVNAVQGWIGGLAGAGVGILYKGKKTLCGSSKSFR